MEEENENIKINDEEKKLKKVTNNIEQSFEKLSKIQNLIKKQSALSQICNS